MKVAYIARATVPSGSTNSIHVAKISDAFASISEDFHLIVYGGDTKASLREVYGVRNDFPVHVIDKGRNGRLEQIVWGCKAIGLARKLKCNAVVTRDPFCALISVFRGIGVVLDLHGDIKHLTGRFYRMLKWKWFVNSSLFHLVTISQGLKDYYVNSYGLDPDRITVLPDGVDIQDFDVISDKLVNLEKNSLHIGFFGKLLVGKGIDLIRRIAAKDPDDIFDIYGGSKEDAEKETQSSFSKNVVFHGRVNNKEVPSIMCDMDVLILPNQEKLLNEGEDIGKFTSPLKLFEYMAAGRCIIASDLPVIREVLNEDNAYFASYDDENEWVNCIEEIKSNSDEAIKKAANAKADVIKYTWKSRAEAMLKLISERNI